MTSRTHAEPAVTPPGAQGRAASTPQYPTNA